MKEINMWAMAFLKSWDKLGDLAASMDKCVANICSDSFFGSTAQGKRTTTMESCDEIINYTYRKQGLIMVKQLVEEILGALTSEQAKLLKLRFVNCFSFEEIAKMQSQSRTHIFRKLNSALDCFCELMQQTDRDLEWCVKNFGNDEIFRLYRQRISSDFANCK